MLLKKVLVAVDGSENADRALDFALDLSEKFDSTLFILNVSESLPMGAVPAETTTSLGPNMPIISKDFRRIHEEILARAVVRAKTAKPNIAVSSILREGDPANEIVNAVKDGGFDIVVVGHRGLGRMKEFFIGGTSEKVSHLAACPVVIVK
jgi:nucleotide-binding universal stress UspA family protein